MPERRQKQAMPLFLFDERVRREEDVSRPAGIDEVGRGPLAGPVVAAAVILKRDARISGLNDSKKLSAKQRRELFFSILAESIACGIGVVDHETIDRENILVATRHAMCLAIADLSVPPDFLMIDAVSLQGVGVPQRNLIRGDGTSACIAAASVIAKEIRDGIMREEHRRFPHYGFIRNMGYGTREHLEALRAVGPCAIHRKSFGPVRSLRLF